MSKQSDDAPRDRPCRSRSTRTDDRNAIDCCHDTMPHSPATQLAPAQAIEIGIRNPQLLQRRDRVAVPRRRAIDPAGVMAANCKHVIDEDVMPAAERET